MLNGYIMCKNIPVIKVTNEDIMILNKDKCPLFFLYDSSVRKWLEERAIDSHRTNSRLLKKALRLEEKDDINTVLKFNAVTITDAFWFKQDFETTLSWENVKFKKNDFAELALNGDLNCFNKEPSRTPELTNIGSFEKCWKFEDGSWWLYKKENDNEKFSELFISKLGTKLGFNMAYYELKDGDIRSKCFTSEDVSFEPISSVLDNDEYVDTFEKLKQIKNNNIIKDYLKMIYLDTICLNVDRHTKNFGFLRDNRSGKIIGLAPNFDNNIALIYRGYPEDITRENDGFMKYFFEFLDNTPEATKLYKELNITKVSKEEVIEIINKIPIKVDSDKVAEFVINGQNKVLDYIENYEENKAHQQIKKDQGEGPEL